MGIENDVRAKYGDEYWEQNRDRILERADKNHQLDGHLKRVRKNSAARRAERRAGLHPKHPERDFDIEEPETEQEETRSLMDIFLGWLLGRESK